VFSTDSPSFASASAPASKFSSLGISLMAVMVLSVMSVPCDECWSEAGAQSLFETQLPLELLKPHIPAQRIDQRVGVRIQ
jgi:hypothetical protein